MTARCDNCRFWKPINDGIDDGECHRHAPQPFNFWDLGHEALKHLTIISWRFAETNQETRDFNGWEDAGSDTHVVWVKTSTDDWCGEHEPKEHP